MKRLTNQSTITTTQDTRIDLSQVTGAGGGDGPHCTEGSDMQQAGCELAYHTGEIFGAIYDWVESKL